MPPSPHTSVECRWGCCVCARPSLVTVPTEFLEQTHLGREGQTGRLLPPAETTAPVASRYISSGCKRTRLHRLATDTSTSPASGHIFSGRDGRTHILRQPEDTVAQAVSGHISSSYQQTHLRPPADTPPAASPEDASPAAPSPEDASPAASSPEDTSPAASSPEDASPAASSGPFSAVSKHISVYTLYSFFSLS
jgi:hypothetical protein